MTHEQPLLYESPDSTRRWFHLDSEFRDELNSLLLRSRPAALALLDRSGSILDLADPHRCHLLAAWLSAVPTARLRLATFVESDLLENAASFHRLRSLKQTQIEWRIIPFERHSQIQQAFALCAEGLVKKPVREAFHGFFDSDPVETQCQLAYFEQIWQICELATPIRPLGL